MHFGLITVRPSSANARYALHNVWVMFQHWQWSGSCLNISTNAQNITLITEKEYKSKKSFVCKCALTTGLILVFDCNYVCIGVIGFFGMKFH